MGGRCSYAHGDTELRFTPEFYKTSLCTAHQKGQCIMGDKCRYAHGDVDMRTSSIYEATPLIGRNGMGGLGDFDEFNQNNTQNEFQMPQATTPMNNEKSQQITQSFNPVNVKDLFG